MSAPSPIRVRHSLRPLSVFSFCGETIATARDEYRSLTKDLPPCPECKRARDNASLVLGGKNRRLV
jgi:hypothetical protein